MSTTAHTLQKPRYLANVSQSEQKPLQISVKEATHPAAVERTERDLDKEYLVRALSHDVGAHLMLLEFSFRQYDDLAKRLATETPSRLHLPSSDREDEKTVPQTARLHLASPLADTPPEAMTVLGEAASHVTACLEEMKRFVNDLISFAKTGSINMEPSAVNITGLVDEVLFEQRHLIQKLNIRVEVSAPLPTVSANPLRIKQILTNLIRNATIHGCDKEEPMIFIASEWVPCIKPFRSEMVGFSVRDNGSGIPPANRERLFEPGYRVPGNQNEGSGIGLAIVKRIACYYGGNVVCQSNANGTAFVVTLPKG